MLSHNPYENPMVAELMRNTISYAVGRAIFCPGCENVLDTDNAVLVTRRDNTGGAAICCGECYDAQIANLSSVDFTAMTFQLDTYDGRELRELGLGA